MHLILNFMLWPLRRLLAGHKENATELFVLLQIFLPFNPFGVKYSLIVLGRGGGDGQERPCIFFKFSA